MDIQVTTIQIIVADPVEGRGYPPPPFPHFYFSDQTEAQRAKRDFFGDSPPAPHLLMSRSGSGTELHLFNNAFVWYSGTRWVKLTL